MTILQKGSKGTEVKALQIALNNKGYNLKADGIFGQGTEDALKDYQKSIRVEVSGKVGPFVAKVLGLTSKPSAVTTDSKKKVIAITAGHNEKDPGAVNGKYTEASIAVETRNAVTERLRKAGYTVLTDGEGSRNDILSNAVKVAKQADLAIEFHLNAASAKTAKGVEALSLDKDKVICRALCKAVSDVLETPVRGGDGGWKSQSSGQHARLAFCQAGGIIMETFFISNDQELAKYFAKKEALFDALSKTIIGHLEK